PIKTLVGNGSRVMPLRCRQSKGNKGSPKIVDVFPGIGPDSAGFCELVKPKDFFNQVFAGLRGYLKIMEFSLNLWLFRSCRASFGFRNRNPNVTRYRAFFPVYSFHKPKYRFI